MDHDAISRMKRVRAACVFFALLLSVPVMGYGAALADAWERLEADGLDVDGRIVVPPANLVDAATANETRFFYETPGGPFFGRLPAELLSGAEGTPIRVRYLPGRSTVALPVDALDDAQRRAEAARRSSRWFGAVGLYVNALVAAWMHNELRRGRLLMAQYRLPLHPDFARKSILGGLAAVAATAVGQIVFRGALPASVAVQVLSTAVLTLCLVFTLGLISLINPRPSAGTGAGSEVPGFYVVWPLIVVAANLLRLCGNAS